MSQVSLKMVGERREKVQAKEENGEEGSHGMNSKSKLAADCLAEMLLLC